MKNILYTIILSFLFSSVCLAEEEMSCEKTWSDYYDNLPESEQNPSDSLFKSVMIDDCHNDYKLMIERQKEMMRDTSMHAYAAGDYATAYKEFKILAEQGDATAQQNLGWMYNNGEGVAQDYKEAMKWWRLAAEQGDVASQLNLGAMHINGEGVIQDMVLAHMWFNIAASGEQSIEFEAKKRRDGIAKQMTSEQIAKAQELARECVEKNYENCG